jgi:hypothetical protein
MIQSKASCGGWWPVARSPTKVELGLPSSTLILVALVAKEHGITIVEHTTAHIIRVVLEEMFDIMTIDRLTAVGTL